MSPSVRFISQTDLMNYKQFTIPMQQLLNKFDSMVIIVQSLYHNSGRIIVRLDFKGVAFQF